MGSCGANRREIEDQSAIKRKFRLKWDKTKLVSHLGIFGGPREERRKEGKKKKKKRKGMKTRVLYGIARICMETMILYGILWVCMDYYGLV